MQIARGLFVNWFCDIRLEFVIIHLFTSATIMIVDCTAFDFHFYQALAFTSYHSGEIACTFELHYV
jgi:hypothetical protein